MQRATTAWAAALLALALHATRAATDPAPLSYGFSECIDNERTLYYYSDEALTCADSSSVIAKPPVHGLRCDVPCERGYFLGANFSGPTPVSGCEKCATGKYSLGGGKLYSKRTGAWSTPLPVDIHTDCVTRNMYTGKWQANCAAWNASSDGALVSSGANSQIMERFEAARLFSSLRISATFVRDGSITYQFRVDAEALSDGLVFTIDDTAVTPLVSVTDGWREASFAVAAGAHTFSWDYTKDYTGDVGADRADLKVIEVVGTAFADTFCHTCGGDMTASGGADCKFCGANEFAAAKSHSELDLTCYPCPDGTVAPAGSIGAAACVAHRACTADDVAEHLTRCDRGHRNATFAWRTPPTCDPALPDSIALPAPQHALACSSCARGFVLTAQDTCEQCPRGERLADGDTECSPCAAGQVPVNALAFGAGTPNGWSDWPSVVDSVSAARAGWRLARDGLAFTMPTSDDDDGVWSRPSRFALPFNATFAHSGFVNVTYALSHVPTFASAGVRAWLELEIADRDGSTVVHKSRDDVDVGDDDDDDDVDDDNDKEVAGEMLGGDVGGGIAHLRHGSENGTFTELVPINVTQRTSKQFTLVLRTTSAAAARLVHVKVLHLGFEGTVDGAAVTCGSCPPGFAAANGTDDAGDIDDDASCHICPAGTYATIAAHGVATCKTCPANTFSAAGAAGACEPCGNNTFSVAGATTCSAPSILRASASTSSNASAALTGVQAPSYDLSRLESLIWGNDSFLFGDVPAALSATSPTAETLLSTASVVPSGGIRIDSAHVVFLGLFRPVDKSWKDQMFGQLVDEVVDAARDRPYVMALTMLNPRDAGHYFVQKTSRYGEVECAAPAQWRVASGGDRMDIVALVNGSGVDVHYSGGSLCRNGQRAATTIRFVCDLRAGTTVSPSAAVRDDATCVTTITWRSAFACPVCDASYFSELRSACTGGKQTVSYRSVQPCYGGAATPTSVPVATCSDVVLDTQTLYTVYAAVSVVGLVVLVLLAAIFVMHRKYRTTYNEYMYLKGRMPTTVATKDDGSKETTFEFANSVASPNVPSPTAPSTHTNSDDASETKVDDNDDIELHVQSV